MGASITLAGENLIAQKFAAQTGLDVARFIFANVPGLDPSTPVDRAAPKPGAGQIVHTHVIPDGNAGYVNPNQVVYSAQIGSDVGDWDFNWIGLETAEGVLLAVAYVALQQKRRNIPPLQIGNNLTRNFLVAFDGAQALTGISIDASTWQHDFTVRLAGIDERERLSNRDVYGRACFFGSSLQVEKVGSVYQVKPGTAYVEGIRLERTAVLPIVPPAFPTTAWLDVALQRELSDVVASWTVVFGADKPDYTDSAGVRHYCVAIADLTNANTLIDRRSVEAIGGPLVAHFAARNGDYEQLRARATTKDDVDLGNLPNAKSDDPESNSSEILATTKGLKFVLSKIVQATESVLGLAKLATQAQTNAGTDDATIVTPKKLRLGFSAYFAANGYIAFPQWLGGLIVQWGLVNVTAAYGNWMSVNYPIRFPNGCHCVIGNRMALGENAVMLVGKAGGDPYGQVLFQNFGTTAEYAHYIAIGS
ncbi:Tail fiber protein [compost metagenome]